MPRNTTTFHFHRLKAVLSIQRRTFKELAAPLPTGHRHALFVLLGERKGSARLLDAIRRELGEPGWAFATGQTDTLRDEGGSDGAA